MEDNKKIEKNVEYLEELKFITSELLSEMIKNKLKGTYEIIGDDSIEWKIQENVRIVILVEGSGGSDDVLNFYYKDPSGKEYMYNKCDIYPHNQVMDLLKTYNDSGYEITKKGLFIKKYKLNIVFKKNN